MRQDFFVEILNILYLRVVCHEELLVVNWWLNRLFRRSGVGRGSGV